ncbi:MAG: hypothetical protein ALECFALPRED_003498 [Alectoria fallacina]|uniref:Uncharacterized protein n=1 Tax=Alectoria fallacina TaxID=1903189 RepID=A0A8H3FMS3_9LECA|nr:MAG: hypothetical protein ALECFALPRED_003498 [Alectoria fallacina]
MDHEMGKDWPQENPKILAVPGNAAKLSGLIGEGNVEYAGRRTTMALAARHQVLPLFQTHA